MNRMVRDVMATPVVSVTPDTSFRRLVQVLQEHQISAVPVVDPDGRLLGMASEADLALKEEHQPDEPAPRLAGRAERVRALDGVVGVDAHLTWAHDDIAGMAARRR